MALRDLVKGAKGIKRAREAKKALTIDVASTVSEETIAKVLADRRIAYRDWRKARQALSEAERKYQTLDPKDSIALTESHRAAERLAKAAQEAYQSYISARNKFYNTLQSLPTEEQEAVKKIWDQTRVAIKLDEIQSAEAAVVFAQAEEQKALTALREAREALQLNPSDLRALQRVIEAEKNYKLQRHLRYNAQTRLNLARADSAVAEEGVLNDLELAAGTEREAILEEAKIAIKRAGISGQEEARHAFEVALAEKNAAQKAWAEARDAVRAARKELKAAQANGDAALIKKAKANLDAAEIASEHAKATYSGKSSNCKTAIKAAAEVGLVIEVAPSAYDRKTQRYAQESDSEDKPYPITATSFEIAATGVELATEGAAYAVDGAGLILTAGALPHLGHNVLAVEDFIIEKGVVPILTSETAAPVVEPVFNAVETTAQATDSALTQAINPIVDYVVKPGISGINKGLIQPTVNSANYLRSLVGETLQSQTSFSPPKTEAQDEAELDQIATGRFPTLIALPEQPNKESKRTKIWAIAAQEKENQNFTPMAQDEICEEPLISLDPTFRVSP